MSGCGHAQVVEALGSMNTVRKFINYKRHKITIYVEKSSEGIRFVNKQGFESVNIHCNIIKEQEISRLCNSINNSTYIYYE